MVGRQLLTARKAQTIRPTHRPRTSICTSDVWKSPTADCCHSADSLSPVCFQHLTRCIAILLLHPTFVGMSRTEWLVAFVFTQLLSTTSYRNVFFLCRNHMHPQTKLFSLSSARPDGVPQSASDYWPNSVYAPLTDGSSRRVSSEMPGETRGGRKASRVLRKGRIMQA